MSSSNNVHADPAELAKFSELAHRWWDMESEFRPLHEINPLRLEWIDGMARLAGRRALDVGCGGGILADSMARKGAQVLGIDLDDKAVKVAQLHALEAGTQNIQALARFVSQRGIPAVFVESSVPQRTVDAVIEAARAQGHTLRIGGELFSDALGAAGTPEGTYIGMVRHNAHAISSALGGLK